MIKSILICFACLLFISEAKAQNDSTTKATTSDTIIASDTAAPGNSRIVATETKKAPISNGPVYKLKPVVDIPLTVINTAWTLYAFNKIYHKPASDPEVVLGLNKNDINWFDRWAVRPYSPSLDKKAYIPFNA